MKFHKKIFLLFLTCKYTTLENIIINQVDFSKINDVF